MPLPTLLRPVRLLEKNLLYSRMKAFYALLFFLAIILISNELANEGFNSGDIGKQVGIAIGVIVVGLFILMLLSGIR